jgi:hypothetical protein
MSQLASSLTGFWSVTSAIWMLPPGRKTPKDLGEDGVFVGYQVDHAVEITTSKLSMARTDWQEVARR